MPGFLTLKALIVRHNGRQAPAWTVCRATIAQFNDHLRNLPMSTHPLKLILCIALGVWLGLVATAATGIFAYNTLVVGKINAVSAAINPFIKHGVHTAKPEEESDSSAMFE